MVERAESPFYPLLYGTFRAYDTSFFGRDVVALFGRHINESFPVQLTFTQRLDSTLLQSFRDGWFHFDQQRNNLNRLDVSRVLSTLTQITFGVAIGYDRARLVHNDLHASNLLYERVADDHLLYYSIQDRYVAVPTYGRVWKQIDFGRATFRVPFGNNNNNTVLIHSRTPLQVSGEWDLYGPRIDLLRAISVFAYSIHMVDPTDLIRSIDPVTSDVLLLTSIFRTILPCDFPSELLTTRLDRECFQSLNMTAQQRTACRSRVFDIAPYLTTSDCRHGMPSELLERLMERYKVMIDDIPTDALIYVLPSS